MKRIYTISTVLGRMDTPSLKLTGKWLVESGFNIGDKLQLIESHNIIILMKVPKKEIEYQQHLKELEILEEKCNYLRKQIL